MLKRPRIVIVDDDANIVNSLEKIFSKEDYHVMMATNGKDALELIRHHEVNVVLTDLMMPGMDGVDLLKTIKTISQETEVILMTAFGTIEKAVEAMKEGAYDFITKPFKKIQIIKSVKRVIEKQSLIQENRALKAQIAKLKEKTIIGNSDVMKNIMDMILQVAPSTATILIQGESGTGKELVARAIHKYSQRAEYPFIAFNCAAIPETILESELFGYEKGAFTGAVSRKEGRFKLADKGTLLLDEIGETSPAVQVKLLRVLQEGEYERLGGTQKIDVDVRILASTNKNLQEEIKASRFREDLYYRLNVINITLPPLRERTSDIPLLANHFLTIYSEKNKKNIRGIRHDVMDIFMSYPWPGNIRELENLIERAVVLARGDVITIDDIPQSLRDEEGERKSLTIALGTPLEEIEKKVIVETLKMTKGDKRLAAQLLGIATRTIYRKV